MSDFEKWWTEVYSAGGYRSSAEQAWNYQQAEVERLNSRLKVLQGAVVSVPESLVTLYLDDTTRNAVFGEEQE